MHRGSLVLQDPWVPPVPRAHLVPLEYLDRTVVPDRLVLRDPRVTPDHRDLLEALVYQDLLVQRDH